MMFVLTYHLFGEPRKQWTRIIRADDMPTAWDKAKELFPYPKFCCSLYGDFPLAGECRVYHEEFSNANWY